MLPQTPLPTSDQRRFADLQRRLHARLYSVHQTERGFVVLRWGRSRELPTLDAVQHFTEIIEGTQHAQR